MVRNRLYRTIICYILVLVCTSSLALALDSEADCSLLVSFVEGMEGGVLSVQRQDGSGDIVEQVQLAAGSIVLEEARRVALRGDDAEELLVVWRVEGSGGFLSFVLLEQKEDSIEVLLRVEGLARGSLEFTPTGLRQREAVYKPADPMAFPSAWRETLWEWDGQGFVSSVLPDLQHQYYPESSQLTFTALSQDIDELITQKALEAKVPPVLIKAIAMVESGGRHYLSDGTVIRGAAGEIGIMQIYPNSYPFTAEEVERLYELEYNIETGIKILLEKKMFSGLNRPVFVEPDNPEMLAMQDDLLESWYFAILSYNGWVNAVNNPLVAGLGKTYQCKVLSHVESMLGVQVAQPPLTVFSQGLPTANNRIPLPGRTSGALPPLLPGTKARVNISSVRIRTVPATALGEWDNRVDVPIAPQSPLYRDEEVLLLQGPSTATRARWYEVGRDGSSLGWSAWQYLPGDNLHVEDYMLLMPQSFAAITGSVVDPLGGVEGVTVALWHEGNLIEETMTASNGHYILSPLQGGTFALTVTKSGYVLREFLSIELEVGEPYVLNAAIALLGDVNLDGYVNAADIVPLNRHALGIEVITEELSLLAADVNLDGNINAADIVPLNRHTLGIDLIK